MCTQCVSVGGGGGGGGGEPLGQLTEGILLYSTRSLVSVQVVQFTRE